MPPPLPPSNTRRRKVPNKANKLPPTYKKRSIAADEGVPLTIKTTTSNNVSPTKSSKDQSSPVKKSIHPKEKQILHVLSQPQIDLWALRELCVTDGGLISDDLREKAWPKLVGITEANQEEENTFSLETISPPSLSVIAPSSVSSFKNTIMASCMDAHQISLDTARCTWHLLTGSQRVKRNTLRKKYKKKVKLLLKKKQNRLLNFINLTLIQSYTKEVKLRYYQGYHDISCIILNVLGGRGKYTSTTTSVKSEDVQLQAKYTAQAMGLELSTKVLAILSHSHLADMMQDNFESLTKALRLIVFPLVRQFDPEVHQHLMDCDMEPFFCLPWIITWFSHDLRDTALVKRLFDLFIASHPLMPIYVSVAMMLHPSNRMEILNADPDFASLHRVLAGLPLNSCSYKEYAVMPSPMSQGDQGSCSSVCVDDDDMSFDGSIMSQDVYKEEGGLGFDDDSVAPSLTSESLLSGCSDGTKVPFQELIDLAVKFMRRVPPRKVLDISRKYFDADTMNELLNTSNVVNMLHQPQAWAIAPYIESDISSKRRKKSVSKMQEVQTKSGDIKSKKNRLAMESAYPHSIISAGIGPDGDGDVIRRRKRRKVLRTSAIVVGVLSILLGMVDRGFMRLPLGVAGIQRADANPTEIIAGYRSSSSDGIDGNKKMQHTPFMARLHDEEDVKSELHSVSSESSSTNEDEEGEGQTFLGTSIEEKVDVVKATMMKKTILQGSGSTQSPKQPVVKQVHTVQTFFKDTLEKFKRIDQEKLRQSLLEDAKTIVNAARYALDEDAEIVVL